MAIRQAFRFLVFGILGLATLAAVAAAILFARLAQGPVSLGVLLPTAEFYLDRLSPSFTFRIEGGSASWRDWHDGLDIRLEGVHVSEADREMLVLPKLDLLFGADALRQAVFVPTAIELTGLSVNIGRLPANLSGLPPNAQAASTGKAMLSQFLAALRAPPDPARPLSYLKRAVVRDGVIEATSPESERIWRADVHDLALARAGSDIAIDGDLTLNGGFGDVGLRLTGDLTLPDGSIAAKLAFSGLNPAGLADAVPTLAPLASIALPIDGEIVVDVGPDITVDRIAFDIHGGSGELRVDETLAAAAGEPQLAQTIAVDSMAVKGTIAIPEQSATIDALDLRFPAGTTVAVPQLDYRFPLRGIAGRGRYVAGHLTVDGLTLDLDGPKLTATVSADTRPGTRAAEAKISVSDLKMDDIRRYWPPTLAPGGLAWCGEHLSRGVVAMDVDLALADGGQGVAISRFQATLSGNGVRVDYLPDLPPVEDARVRGTFNLEQLALTIEAGHAGSLVVRGGTVVIDQFDRPVEHIALDLDIDGPLDDAVQALSRKPLQYTKSLNLKPGAVEGQLALHLRLAFPLLDEPPLEQVQLLVSANISDAAIEPDLFGIPVRDGAFQLRVNSHDLKLGGTVELAGIHGRIAWDEDFDDRAPLLTRVDFTARDVPVEHLVKRVPAIDLARFLTRGSLDGEIHFLRPRQQPYELSAKIDFSHTDIHIPQLGWTKPVGVRTVAEITARLNDHGLIAIPSLSAYGGGVVLNARVRFDNLGRVQDINVSHLISGRTDLKGEISARDGGGWDVEASGTSLDISPIWGAIERGESLGFEPGPTANATKASSVARHDDGKPPPFFSASADIGTVWFGEGRSLHRVTATAVRSGGEWSLMQVDASLPAGGTVTATLTPGEPGRRTLRVDATDAGGALRALALLDDMRGGTLRINGEIDDRKPGSPIEGVLRVRNYAIVRAPFLARLLNVLALSGIIGALQGTGIQFSNLVMPFVWNNDTLELSNARAHGNALGLTTSGTVDTTTGGVDLRGTLVPFYFLNSALGRLPVIGPLFTGDEKGGGLFAAAYTVRGSLDDPNVTVNPLSTFAPGILRDVLIWIENQFFPPTAVEPQ